MVSKALRSLSKTTGTLARTKTSVTVGRTRTERSKTRRVAGRLPTARAAVREGSPHAPWPMRLQLWRPRKRLPLPPSRPCQILHSSQKLIQHRSPWRRLQKLQWLRWMPIKVNPVGNVFWKLLKIFFLRHRHGLGERESTGGGGFRKNKMKYFITICLKKRERVTREFDWWFNSTRVSSILQFLAHCYVLSKWLCWFHLDVTQTQPRPPHCRLTVYIPGAYAKIM